MTKDDASEGLGSYSYTWDAEGWQLSAKANVVGTTTNYTYDGDGNRVKKSDGTTTTLYWYGTGGNILTETDGAGTFVHDYIYFAGQRLAMLQASTPYFYRGDPIGSARQLTSSIGTAWDESDFTPFGSEMVHVNNLSQNYKFAGMERDAETGNDHTQNRQYASNFGRWLSPDPGGIKVVTLADPQTWNLYSYVRDNPLTLTDPSGLSPQQVEKEENNDSPEGSAAEKDQQQDKAMKEKAEYLNQIPPKVKAAIVASVKASNSSTADDKKGGFHEEGGIAGTDLKTGATIVSPAKPGPVSNPGDKDAHIDVGNAVNPALNNQVMPNLGWHVHPKGAGDRQFVQPPSDRDKANAYFKINIVVGAGNNRVYFYNSSGVIFEMSLKQFEKEP